MPEYLSYPDLLVMIRNKYREYLADWHLAYATTMADLAGHTPTEGERLAAFQAWLSILYGVYADVPEIVEALYD